MLYPAGKKIIYLSEAPFLGASFFGGQIYLNCHEMIIKLSEYINLYSFHKYFVGIIFHEYIEVSGPLTGLYIVNCDIETS